MRFHGGIFLVVQVMMMQLGIGLATLATTSDEFAIAKPGCLHQCGDLSIPYPFGMDKEYCFLSEEFRITCNYSSNPPKAYFSGSTINVIHISLPQGQLQILKYIARDCYDQNGTAREDNFNNPSLTLGPLFSIFTVSDTQNKFVAVGCDTYALVRGEKDGKNYTTGCTSICDKMEYVNQSCTAGAGCCESSIPKGLKGISMELSSYNNHEHVWDFNPCSYAFIVDENEFNFSPSFVLNLNKTEKLPMVLDWAFSNETCEVAQKNMKSYGCKGNSTCYEPPNKIGYRCNCLEGYQGNPYLNDCQDIDECKDSRSHKCEKPSSCLNTVGNYSCPCPNGYHGDGRKGGKGCIPNQAQVISHLQVIQIALGGSGGSLLLLLGGFWSYKVIRRMRKIKRKEKFFKRNGGLLLQQQMSSEEGTIEKTKIFTSKDLEKATDNFNDNRILGQGGQGTVYKGMLTDGRIVAIKKSKLVDESQLKQFINEVVILSQINHRNVVNLLGCCLETNVPLLVYEFVSNGNLFELIHGQNEEFPLSWEMRLQIATEVAGAVAFLHSGSSLPIYHRDIKSTNILLDDKYRAKVSDFGTSRSISIDQTHLTTLVHGTFGYLDPEYFQSSQFTEKSDVYSFGVVLAELLTGQKPISSIRSQEDKSLAIYFILSIEENHLFDILDAQVMKEGGKEDIMAVANLARRCLNLNGRKRPTMKEVTMELEGIRRSIVPLNSQQNFEEDECIVELTGPMNGVSVSTSSYLDHPGTSSSDAHPLLYSKA